MDWFGTQLHLLLCGCVETLWGCDGLWMAAGDGLWVVYICVGAAKGPRMKLRREEP